MRRAVRFLIVLLVGLGLLSIGGYIIVTRTLSRWFDADLELRSRLAVVAAHQSLASSWEQDDSRLENTLTDITRDERIMAAAACSSSGALLASTQAFPRQFSCRALLDRMRSEAPPGAVSWSMARRLPSGPVHLSLTRFDDGTTPLGSVVLVHDVSYLERREATTRNLWLVAVCVLCAAASLVTLGAARFFWRGWTLELQRALTGQATQEFQPLVRDVRALVERLAHERDRDVSGGPWSSERLRSALTKYLQGEHIVILANREPYIHQKTATGVRVVHPASGLVTALEPVMRACSGVWIAHGSGDADRDVVDANDRIRVPPGEESISCAAYGSAKRRRTATTTASPTRGSGRCATSRTRGPCFAPTTGSTT